MLDVEWHESGSGRGGRQADALPFDVALHCPQLKEQVFRFDRYAKATAVLPLRVVARPHPLKSRTLVCSGAPSRYSVLCGCWCPGLMHGCLVA